MKVPLTPFLVLLVKLGNLTNMKGAMAVLVISLFWGLPVFSIYIYIYIDLIKFEISLHLVKFEVYAANDT